MENEKEIRLSIEELDAAEDREKVLRIIYEEFRREYSSDIR